MNTLARTLNGNRFLARRRLLGLAVLAVVAAVLALASIKPNPFDDPRTVRAVFEDGAGIGVVDRNVRVGGVNVGEIGEVRRVGDDAEIELKIHDDLGEIYRDARAELRPHTAFEGTAFVELYPGTPGTEPLGDRTIPKSRTRVYVSLDKALRVLRAPTREAIQRVAGDLAGGLAGEAQRGLQQTLRRAPALTRDLAVGARALQGPGGDELAGAIRGMSQTIDALASREEQLVPLVRGAHRTFAALNADRGASLDASLAQLPPALAELDRGGRALLSVVDRLDPLAAELRPAMAELRPALRELRPFLRQARPTFERLRPLVRDLRPALDRTARAVPETRALLDALDPSLRLLDRSLLPYLHTESRLGLPVYLQTLAFASGGAGALRVYQTEEQNPLGWGHGFRFDGNVNNGLGPANPPCPLIADLNPEFGQRAEEGGLCQP